MSTWLFLGDAHLNPHRKDRSWGAFAQLVEQFSPEGLVLMGDFFDFWFDFGGDSPLLKLYQEIGDVFQALKAMGTKVLFLEGNHDFGLGGELFGVAVEHHRWGTSLELGGRKIYLCHGDRAAGLPYSLPALLLKNPLSCRLLKVLGPGLVTRAAFWWCRRPSNTDRIPQVRQRLERFAERKISQGFDVIVMAHCHTPEARKISSGGRTGLYFNVGSWQRGDYLLWQKGLFRLEKFPKP